MSLATRCSACGTVFRVQKDQLKASEGWVRCGRCGTVFSALEGLFDLEREEHSGPMPLQPAASPATSAPRDPPPQGPAKRASPPPPPSTEPVPAAAAAVADPGPAPGAASTLEVLHDDPHAQAAVERAASSATFRALQPAPIEDDEDDEDEGALSLLEHSGSHTLGESRPLESGHSGFDSHSGHRHSGHQHTAPEAAAFSPSKLPSFARETDGEELWRRQRPVVRRLTIAAAAALPLVLGLQMAVHHRDMLAARWPATADVLQALCAPLECTVRAPRALEALSVESSGLSRVEGTALYRLQLAIRNRADWAVTMPALDVTLTDLRGEVVSRRVLRAADLAQGAAPQELAAGAEWSALATIDVGERRVSGYAVDLFYP